MELYSLIICWSMLTGSLWGLYTNVPAGPYGRFTRDHGIEKDESEYLAAFSEEIVVTADVPKWLWNGIRILKHPTMIIHQPDQELSVSNYNDGLGGATRYECVCVNVWAAYSVGISH